MHVSRGAGRCLVVDDANCLDLMISIRRKPLLEHIGTYPPTPVSRDQLWKETDPLRKLAPQSRKLPGLVHQNLVAGGKRIDQGRLPRASARRWEYNHRLNGLEDRSDLLQSFFG